MSAWNVETPVLSLSWEDPLEKEMATHSSTLAWSMVSYSPWGRGELDMTVQFHFLSFFLRCTISFRCIHVLSPLGVFTSILQMEKLRHRERPTFTQ